MNDDILTELASLAQERQNESPANSYIADLLQGDENLLLKKIIEEAGETALAAKGKDPDKLKEEMADLWFHCIVAMTRYGISIDDVLDVLRKRRGMSGIEEKNSRKKHTD